ncbi:MAG: hypothetical protein HC836_46955 [Richelia sp. RM2_1_2]|nr:hypothetical protein [Richelia sp. RM2_1_2]
MNEQRINNEITSRFVKIVSEDGLSKEMMKVAALRIAQDQGLDLIEVDCRGDMSICKIYDYNKKKYHEQKNMKNQKNMLLKQFKQQ